MSIQSIVDSALDTALSLAEGATDAAGDALQKAKEGYVEPFMQTAEGVYNACLAKGMTPEDAMDATEKYMRELTGRIII